MNFIESISTCFRKYATFEGTASRSEYWWFWLFLVVGAIVIGSISNTLAVIFNLATLVPSLAAGARRLHDTDRSGWWQLLALVPVVGWIALIILLAQESKANRYSATVIPA